jgi:hypothetical protein
MTQDEINLQEWSNPDNWSDGAIRTYFSKKDTRVFVRPPPVTVRQNTRASGSGISIRTGPDLCVNMGHKRGVIYLLMLVLIPFLFLLALIVFVFSSKGSAL